MNEIENFAHSYSFLSKNTMIIFRANFEVAESSSEKSEAQRAAHSRLHVAFT